MANIHQRSKLLIFGVSQRLAARKTNRIYLIKNGFVLAAVAFQTRTYGRYLRVRQSRLAAERDQNRRRFLQFQSIHSQTVSIAK